MNTDEAAKILKKEVESGRQTNEVVVNIHLFGIKYAQELSELSLREIVARAEIPESYRTEIRNGMNLARYVRLKS